VWSRGIFFFGVSFAFAHKRNEMGKKTTEAKKNHGLLTLFNFFKDVQTFFKRTEKKAKSIQR
jgi:hypothetical protein